MAHKLGPMMKQATFDWDTEDYYSELKNFRLQVYNVFINHKICHNEKTALIKNWLGRKGFQLLGTITQTEKGKCETSKTTQNTKWQI